MKCSLPALLFAAAAVGQSTWVAQAPSTRPSPRNTPAMAYDAATQSVLAYGGFLTPAFTATLTVPVFVLGFSNTLNAGPPGYPLPFDLGPLGWPGCQQLVSYDVGAVTFSLTGQADLPFVVPFNLTLLGLVFHAQAFVLYQPTGAAVSNAITGVVGS